MSDYSGLIPAGMQNPRIKQYLSVKKNTKSNPENLLCLEGFWEVATALDTALEFRAFFVCPELLRGDTGHHLAQRVIASGVHSYLVSEKVMERIADRDDPDGLAAIVQLPRHTWETLELRDQMRLLVLDGVEIPGNVGTMIRSADSAGAHGVVITNRRTRLSHPKLLHASMGSLFSFPVIESELDEAIDWLHGNGFKIITTDTDASESYRKADYTGRVAIVMGSERYGIMKDWYQAQSTSVAIPMAGRVDSLNVANAAVLMLYEAFSQQEPERF